MFVDLNLLERYCYLINFEENNFSQLLNFKAVGLKNKIDRNKKTAL